MKHAKPIRNLLLAVSAAIGGCCVPAFAQTVQFAPPSNPPIGTSFVTAKGGQLWLDGNRFVGAGANFTVWSWSRTSDVNLNAQIKNYATAGFRIARLNDMDGTTSDNLFNSGNNPQTGTRTLDAVQMNQLCRVISIFRANNVRVIVTLHQLRQLVPPTPATATAPATPGDTPPWPCPTFNECINTKISGIPGRLDPAMWFDDGLQQLLFETDKQILTWPDPYNGGAPLGKNPAILAWTLHNEQSLVKLGPFGFGPIAAGLAAADAQAYCANHGIAWKGQILGSLNKQQIQQWLAYRETTVLAARAANVRSMSPALVIAGTYFGNAPYTALVSMAAVGDILDCHCYSRSQPTDTNAMLTIPGGAKRTPFEATLAACSWLGIPTSCSEYGFAAQNGSATLDPVAEQVQGPRAALRSGRRCDLSLMCLYAWGEGGLSDDKYTKTGAYDSRVNANLCRGLQEAVYQFNDLSLRPTATQSIPLTTARLFGSGTGSAFVLPVPATDPDVLNAPVGARIVMTPAPAAASP